jgi:hypothetical protein
MWQLSWLDRTFVRSAVQEMMLRGMTKEDSICAAVAANFIQVFDRVCMPIGAPKILVECRLQPHQLVMARYFPKSSHWPNIRERYEIVVPDLHNRIVQECSRHGNASVGVMLAALGAHEVRHRLQWHSSLQCFTPFCRAGRNPFLQKMIGELSRAFKEKHEASKSVREKKLAAYFYSNLEFDSQVIELLMVRYASYCISVADLAKVVRSEITP